MPSESSTTNPVQPKVAIPSVLLAGDARTYSASQKGAATVRRHKQEQRAESLDQIRAQIADGTLVVRQMTVEQHKSASQAAHNANTRHETRRALSKALGSER